MSLLNPALDHNRELQQKQRAIVARLLKIPYASNGRTWPGPGLDCVGLVLEYLRQNGTPLELPTKEKLIPQDRLALHIHGLHPSLTTRDHVNPTVWFWARKNDLERKVVHVTLAFPDGSHLTTTPSGPVLWNTQWKIFRYGMVPVGWLGTVDGPDRQVLSHCLAHEGIHFGSEFLVAIIISAVLTAAAIALTPRPKLGSQIGRYGFGQLTTTNLPEIAIPDVLGTMVVAGNVIYQQPVDKTAAVTNPALQRSTVYVGICHEIVDNIDSGFASRINGNAYDSNVHFSSNGYTGFLRYPGQTRAEALEGTSASWTGNRPTYFPSYGSEPNPDISASYIRSAPFWSLNHLAYFAFRLSDSTKFSTFQMTCKVKGRKLREFNATGWLTTAFSSSYTANGTDVRFPSTVFPVKRDLVGFTTVTVGGTAHTEQAPGNQTGNVYWVQRSVGYINFLTPPGSGVTVALAGTYYTASHSSCPARILLHLLTHTMYGRGWPDTAIDWQSFDDLQQACATTVTTLTSDGPVTGPQFEANYLMDQRKPIQDHLQAILETCRSMLVLTGGKIRVIRRVNGTSVLSLGPDQILQDTFTWTLVDRRQVPNRLRCFFHDERSENVETHVVVEDVIDIEARAARSGGSGVMEAQVKLAAVTNLAQAQRLAQAQLEEGLGVQYRGKFTTTLVGLPLDPWDIIDITHSSHPIFAGFLARVESTSTDDQGRIIVEWSQYVPL